MIVRFLSLSSIFPTGKGETSLIQVNLGGGYPSARQVSCIAVDSTFETSDEGTLVKIGRPNRRRKFHLAEKSYWLLNFANFNFPTTPAK